MTQQATTEMINSEYFTDTKEKLFDKYRTELSITGDTLERAEEILQLAHENELIEGRCYPTMITAATILAAREQNVPRIADGFADITREHVKDVETKKVRSKSRELKNKLNIRVKPTSREKYLEYFLNELNANEETRETANDLLEAAKDEEIAVNAAPNSIAAGIVDAARRLSGEEIVQDEISDVSHVSVPQLRTYYQKISQEV